jgi:hypothetical protein
MAYRVGLGLPLFQKEHPEQTKDWDIIFDARGHLVEPHTGFAPPLARSTLAVDQPAVGKPALDLLRQAQLPAQLKPITITAGHAAAPDERGGWLVPKPELVSTLRVLPQTRRTNHGAGAGSSERP